MSADRFPTTREIATACGCSQSTVSNALRNDTRISEETRLRIQRVATEMGWKSNPLAAAFMAHLRSTKPARYQASIAFCVSNPDSPRIEDLPPHQRENFHGARERAEQLGYVLEPIWVCQPGMTAEGLGRMLFSRGTPGLIIPRVITPSPVFSGFDWDSFSAVALAHTLFDLPLHRVTFNYNRSVPMALRRLYELGYRRIGVIVSNAYDEKV
ncbi:MAG: LacI family DNA-binding transcriptional regulator, partial [Rariglobus sp.]